MTNNSDFHHLGQSIEVQHILCDELRPYKNNPRTHSKKQIDQIANSIREFGFTNPILIDEENNIIAGHGRIMGAKQIGLDRVPAIRLEHLSEVQKKAYIIADNKLAENAGWDEELLQIEIQGLVYLDDTYDLSLTGFETPEIDGLLLDLSSEPIEEDPIPKLQGKAVSQQGDLWILGDHKILCADALKPCSYQKLLGDEKAGMVFTDPPYNVPVNGHVCGNGKIQHREFAMASGEMSEDEFTHFLRQVFENLGKSSLDGSLHYICMDWRHMSEVLNAGKKSYSELKNLCVWNKTNGGMGSLYRSKHELVFVYKHGTGPHMNNIELGKHGRYRTNVWDYQGVNVLGSERQNELALHPTVKPVPMIADAILDCTKHGAIILDSFGGSGSTLMAAEQTGRKARLIELDPLYVDVSIRRWQDKISKSAVNSKTGLTFNEVSKEQEEKNEK